MSIFDSISNWWDGLSILQDTKDKHYDRGYHSNSKGYNNFLGNSSYLFLDNDRLNDATSSTRAAIGKDWDSYNELGKQQQVMHKIFVDEFGRNVAESLLNDYMANSNEQNFDKFYEQELNLYNRKKALERYQNMPNFKEIASFGDKALSSLMMNDYKNEDELVEAGINRYKAGKVRTTDNAAISQRDLNSYASHAAYLYDPTKDDALSEGKRKETGLKNAEKELSNNAEAIKFARQVQAKELEKETAPLQSQYLNELASYSDEQIDSEFNEISQMNGIYAQTGSKDYRDHWYNDDLWKSLDSNKKREMLAKYIAIAQQDEDAANTYFNDTLDDIAENNSDFLYEFMKAGKHFFTISGSSIFNGLLNTELFFERNYYYMMYGKDAADKLYANRMEGFDEDYDKQTVEAEIEKQTQAKVAEELQKRRAALGPQGEYAADEALMSQDEYEAINKQVRKEVEAPYKSFYGFGADYWNKVSAYNVFTDKAIEDIETKYNGVSESNYIEGSKGPSLTNYMLNGFDMGAQIAAQIAISRGISLGGTLAGSVGSALMSTKLANNLAVGTLRTVSNANRGLQKLRTLVSTEKAAERAARYARRAEDLAASKNLATKVSTAMHASGLTGFMDFAAQSVGATMPISGAYAYGVYHDSYDANKKSKDVMLRTWFNQMMENQLNTPEAQAEMSQYIDNMLQNPEIATAIGGQEDLAEMAREWYMSKSDFAKNLGAKLKEYDAQLDNLARLEAADESHFDNIAETVKYAPILGLLRSYTLSPSMRAYSAKLSDKLRNTTNSVISKVTKSKSLGKLGLLQKDSEGMFVPFKFDASKYSSINKAINWVSDHRSQISGAVIGGGFSNYTDDIVSDWANHSNAEDYYERVNDMMESIQRVYRNKTGESRVPSDAVFEDAEALSDAMARGFLLGSSGEGTEATQSTMSSILDTAMSASAWDSFKIGLLGSIVPNQVNFSRLFSNSKTARHKGARRKNTETGLWEGANTDFTASFDTVTGKSLVDSNSSTFKKTMNFLFGQNGVFWGSNALLTSGWTQQGLQSAAQRNLRYMKLAELNESVRFFQQHKDDIDDIFEAANQVVYARQKRAQEDWRASGAAKLIGHIFKIQRETGQQDDSLTAFLQQMEDLANKSPESISDDMVEQSVKKILQFEKIDSEHPNYAQARAEAAKESKKALVDSAKEFLELKSKMDTSLLTLDRQYGSALSVEDKVNMAYRDVMDKRLTDEALQTYEQLTGRKIDISDLTRYKDPRVDKRTLEEVIKDLEGYDKEETVAKKDGVAEITREVKHHDGLKDKLAASKETAEELEEEIKKVFNSIEENKKDSEKVLGESTQAIGMLDAESKIKLAVLSAQLRTTNMEQALLEKQIAEAEARKKYLEEKKERKASKMKDALGDKLAPHGTDEVKQRIADRHFNEADAALTEEELIIPSDEIKTLDPSAMLYMIANVDSYSEAQKAEIEKAVGELIESNKKILGEDTAVEEAAQRIQRRAVEAQQPNPYMSQEDMTLQGRLEAIQNEVLPVNEYTENRLLNTLARIEAIAETHMQTEKERRNPRHFSQAELQRIAAQSLASIEREHTISQTIYNRLGEIKDTDSMIAYLQSLLMDPEIAFRFSEVLLPYYNSKSRQNDPKLELFRKVYEVAYPYTNTFINDKVGALDTDDTNVLRILMSIMNDSGVDIKTFVDKGRTVSDLLNEFNENNTDDSIVNRYNNVRKKMDEEHQVPQENLPAEMNAADMASFIDTLVQRANQKASAANKEKVEAAAAAETNEKREKARQEAETEGERKHKEDEEKEKKDLRDKAVQKEVSDINVDEDTKDVLFRLVNFMEDKLDNLYQRSLLFHSIKAFLNDPATTEDNKKELAQKLNKIINNPSTNITRAEDVITAIGQIDGVDLTPSEETKTIAKDNQHIFNVTTEFEASLPQGFKAGENTVKYPVDNKSGSVQSVNMVWLSQYSMEHHDAETREGNDVFDFFKANHGTENAKAVKKGTKVNFLYDKNLNCIWIVTKALEGDTKTISVDGTAYSLVGAMTSSRGKKATEEVQKSDNDKLNDSIFESYLELADTENGAEMQVLKKKDVPLESTVTAKVMSNNTQLNKGGVSIKRGVIDILSKEGFGNLKDAAKKWFFKHVSLVKNADGHQYLKCGNANIMVREMNETAKPLTPDNVSSFNTSWEKTAAALKILLSTHKSGGLHKYISRYEEAKGNGDAIARLNEEVAKDFTQKVLSDYIHLANDVSISVGYDNANKLTFTVNVSGNKLADIGEITLTKGVSGEGKSVGDTVVHDFLKALAFDENDKLRTANNMPILKYQADYASLTSIVDENASDEEAKKYRDSQVREMSRLWEDDLLYSTNLFISPQVGTIVVEDVLNPAESKEASSLVSEAPVGQDKGEGNNSSKDGEGGNVNTPSRSKQVIDDIAKKATEMHQKYTADRKKMNEAEDATEKANLRRKLGIGVTRITGGARAYVNSVIGMLSKALGTNFDAMARHIVDHMYNSKYGRSKESIVGNFGGASATLWEKFYDQMTNVITNIQDAHNGHTLTPVCVFDEKGQSIPIRVEGDIIVVDGDRKGTLKLSGEVDLLFVDENGDGYLYDFKTKYSTSDSNNVKDHFKRSDDGVESNTYADTEAKWARQLNVYARLLEKNYGIKIVHKGIIPIMLNYDKSGTTSDYTIESGEERFQRIKKDGKTTYPVKGVKVMEPINLTHKVVDSNVNDVNMQYLKEYDENHPSEVKLQDLVEFQAEESEVKMQTFTESEDASITINTTNRTFALSGDNVDANSALESIRNSIPDKLKRWNKEMAAIGIFCAQTNTHPLQAFYDIFKNNEAINKIADSMGKVEKGAFLRSITALETALSLLEAVYNVDVTNIEKVNELKDRVAIVLNHSGTQVVFDLFKTILDLGVCEKFKTEGNEHALKAYQSLMFDNLGVVEDYVNNFVNNSESDIRKEYAMFMEKDTIGKYVEQQIRISREVRQENAVNNSLISEMMKTCKS